MVHLWRFSLCRPHQELTGLTEMLTADEIQRANAFRFDIHRQRFIVGRGLMRRVLAGYLGCAPDEIAFRYSEHGKPLLANRPSQLPIEFSLAHSADQALLAVTCAGRVGVDLEQIRPLEDLAGVARSAFSPRECSDLFSFAPAAQHAAFFRVWSRKEAVLKALGTGFSLPSRSFDVSVLGDADPRLESTPPGILRREDWSLLDVPAPDGFAAAVAVEHPSARVVIREFVE